MQSQDERDASQESSANLEDYDMVLIAVCDLHGTGRGRFVFKSSLKGVAKNGLGTTHASLYCGVLCDIPKKLTMFSDGGWANGSMVPDISTLAPITWLSNSHRKVGYMVCNMFGADCVQDGMSSRVLAINQLTRLSNLGFRMVTSYYTEFMVCRRGEQEPVAMWEDISQLLSKLLSALRMSGIPVLSIGRALEPGKIQLSFPELSGLSVADYAHSLRYALRSICGVEGYDVTYMTKPFKNISGCRSCFTYTLYDSDGRNVFSSTDDSERLSNVGSQWLNGLLCHQAAMLALFRPTANCYREESDPSSGQCLSNLGSHGLHNIRWTSHGAFLEESLPSSASNPYLVLASIIIAGIDGMTRKLSNEEMDASHIKSGERLPASLEKAIISLNSDTEFKDAIGPMFVYCFTYLKEEFELKRVSNNKSMDTSECNDLDFERSLYLNSL